MFFFFVIRLVLIEKHPKIKIYIAMGVVHILITQRAVIIKIKDDQIDYYRYC